MKNTCFIHIGMHKTGSSSIQESLYGFADAGFFYANIKGKPNHSIPICALYTTQLESSRWHKARERSPSELADYLGKISADLERSIRSAGERNLIISGEAISMLQRSGLKRLRNDLRRHFDELTIVGYVRPPAGYMSSSFQQRVKGGAGLSVDADLYYRNYRATFEPFDEVFGREHVHLWKYEPRSFPGQCVVRDFCTRLGIALPEKKIVRLNESLSRQVLALLYCYHRYAKELGDPPQRRAETKLLMNALADLGDDKFRFSPEVVRPVLKRNRADIAWMEARLGQSLLEELGEHQPGDVRDECDMLDLGAPTMARLRGMLGASMPDGATAPTALELARLVHALRSRLTEDATARRQGLGAVQLLKRVEAATPELLDGLPEKTVKEFVAGVFNAITTELATVDEGALNYAWLGSFQSSQRSHRGARKEKSVKRILFVQPKREGHQ